MGKSYKKQTIKYMILQEQKPLTLEDIETIENELSRENQLEHKGQLDLLLDLILKN